MRYTITSQQLNFFQKEHNLELEGLYTIQEGHLLQQLIKAMNNPTGRDLHRENHPLLRALHLSRLGQVASQLFGKKKLRLAFTQAPPFLDKILSLEEGCSISEMRGGCLLNLESGATTFYDASYLLDFSRCNHAHFFIAFASDKARYKLQENDPHAHLLKKLGYGFGDLLSNNTHPLICK